MKVNIQNSPNFHAIQLTAKEAERAALNIDKLLDTNVAQKERQLFKNELFSIFGKYLQNEAKMKTRMTLVYKEVLAEIYLKFSELLYDIQNNPTLEFFIDKLNKFRPSKDAMKSEYIHNSLDVPVSRWNKSGTIADYIIENNLPNPISAVEREKIKNKLNSAIENAKLSEIMEERLQKRADGVPVKTIAKEEGISQRVATETVRKGVLRIKKQNNNLPKEVIDKSATLAGLLGCSEEKMLDIILYRTDFLSKSSEKIMQNIKESAELLGCSEQEFINAALKQPTLLGMKPETIMKHAQMNAKVCDCDVKFLINKALKKQPVFLFLKSETLERNIRESAKNIGCSEKEFINAGLRKLTILYLKPETLLKTVQTASSLLGCSVQDFVKTALKQPILFAIKPETIKNNAVKSSELMGCSFEDYITASIKYGNLLYQTPETLNNNVERSAKLLGIPKEIFVQMALKHPPLFYQKPETIKENAEGMAKILNMSLEEYLTKILKKPSVLSQKPETIKSKLQITAYYQKVKNEKSQNIVIVQDSNDKLYAQILAYLIQQLNNSEFDEFVKVRKTFNLENFLKANADKNFCFEIPDDEVAEDFVKCIQEISTKTIGKNIFEFKITKQK